MLKAVSSPSVKRQPLFGLSRSTAAAMELLGSAFGGIVVSDRFSAYNHLPLEQRQICWAHVIRDLTANTERPGARAEYGAELLKWQGLQRRQKEPWFTRIDRPPQPRRNQLLAVP